MIDENEFFRGATLRICGNLAIEDAMRACTRYIGELIPLDRKIGRASCRERV